MEKIRGLKIRGGQQQKLILLKLEMADHYIFCKIEKVDSKICISSEKRINLRPATATIAEITSFLHPWFNHRCRYGGGKILNKSGTINLLYFLSTWTTWEQRR
jgi:hypothetical protein